MAKTDEAQQDPEEDALTLGLRSGMYVFMMLGVLTLGEFLVASIASSWTLFLWIVALWKVFLVVKNYMHVGVLFAPDEEAH